MNGLNLIKELNENIREKDEFEKALAEAGIDFDLGDGESRELPPADGDADMEGEYADAEGDIEDDVNPELARIADQRREESDDMSDDELRDAIGDDLEQLEYQPEEISDGIETVMDLLGRGQPDEVKDNGDDFEDEINVDDDPNEEEMEY